MVVKNTMLRLAVKGTSLEGLAEQFKGDTAIERIGQGLSGARLRGHVEQAGRGPCGCVEWLAVLPLRQ